ncbi:hypothetical protein T10_3875 [Trichinella papuae]|uniref:Uncharacterized protein n=1 Tax=Trichinella papuae TaxID=268474 RepID=A0A0V1M241_9BILA|nr:hypothetical protein T10_3875 [Trichinella papuae]
MTFKAYQMSSGVPLKSKPFRFACKEDISPRERISAPISIAHSNADVSSAAAAAAAAVLPDVSLNLRDDCPMDMSRDGSPVFKRYIGHLPFT